MRQGNLTVADLARWFGRPHPTVRGWTNGTKIGAAALDHAWIMGTVVEAWARRPTTVGAPTPPAPPAPPTPPAPPVATLATAEALRAGRCWICPSSPPFHWVDAILDRPLPAGKHQVM